MAFGPRAAGNHDVYISTHRNFYGRGGALVFATGLNRALRERGVSTLFLNQAAEGDPVDAEFDGTPQCNVTIAGSALLWRFKSWLFTRRLERALRAMPPPRRAFVSMSFYWVAAAKRAWPATRVVYPMPCLLANCTPFTWPSGRAPSIWKWLDYRGVRRAEHAACAGADVILTPTEQAREEVLAFHPLIGGEIRACAYGPAPIAVSSVPRRALREALGLGEDNVLLLAVGACEPNKGFDLAIREWVTVERRGALAIVGEGPDRAAYERLAAELKVSERVFVLGLQPEIEPWLAAADGVLSTSQYDMFPLSIQEGWAAGRPTIVPEHAPPAVYAGSAEVVWSAGGGLLYERNRAGALAECVNRFVADRGLREALAVQAERIGRERAGWDRYVDVILNTETTKSPGLQSGRTRPDEEPRVSTRLVSTR